MEPVTEIIMTRFIRVEDVMKITGIARSTIYAWISQGHFPAPVAIGLRASRFRLREIEDWAKDPVRWRAEHACASGTKIKIRPESG